MNVSYATKNKTLTSKAIIQPKLMVNAPNDVYEQEADAVADRVMRMPLVSSKVQGTQGMLASSVQRKCAHCEEEEKKKPIMRKAEGGGGFETSPAFASQLSNTSGGGQAMPRETKSFMENRFGQDFSHVRLHTDGTAADMSAGIQAKAFTHGSDIYFNRGEFEPNTEGGKRLLAHELTHTVQQRQKNATIQRMIECPRHLNDGAPTPTGWREYPNSTAWFHCGYRTILEDRSPTPDDPMNECVYDHSGVLVDDNHRYSGCQGTPDQYDSRTDPGKHATIDSGGIVRRGLPAIIDSGIRAINQPFEDFYNWLDSGIRRLYGVP